MPTRAVQCRRFSAVTNPQPKKKDAERFAFLYTYTNTTSHEPAKNDIYYAAGRSVTTHRVVSARSGSSTPSRQWTRGACKPCTARDAQAASCSARNAGAHRWRLHAAMQCTQPASTKHVQRAADGEPGDASPTLSQHAHGMHALYTRRPILPRSCNANRRRRAVSRTQLSDRRWSSSSSQQHAVLRRRRRRCTQSFDRHGAARMPADVGAEAGTLVFRLSVTVNSKRSGQEQKS